MNTVNQVSQTDTSLYTYGVAGSNAAQKAQAAATELPAGQSLSDILDSLDLPDLPLSMRGISVDTLLNAVADEERRNGIQAAVDSIETHGEAMNAENEIAVAAYLREEISFYGISELVAETMDGVEFVASPSLDDIFATNEAAKEYASALIEKRKGRW